MATTGKPGTSSGKSGGIYQEHGPRGGAKPNFATVPDNTRFPPTSKPGSNWESVKKTPDSKR